MPQTIDNLSVTWANSLTTFTAFKFNAIDNASAAGSLLMDLQVGGSSQFKVAKNGNVTMGAIFHPSSAFDVVVQGTTSFKTNNGQSITRFELWLGDGSLANPAILRRRTNNNIQLGAADAAAPVAQTLSVQSVVAGTTNTAGANLTITGSQGTGTGAGGSIVFQVAPAGSSGTAQNALATALTIDSSRSVEFAGSVTIPTANLTVGGSGSGLVTTRGLQILSGQAISFSDGSAYNTIIRADAANTLALRNGANAQFLRVYSTYTDASNYERGAINTGADFVELAAETAGTGDDNLDVRLTPAGTGNVRFGTHTGTADTAVSGYIEIKDAGGTIRKLAVIT